MSAGQQLMFDRSTGALSGASAVEQFAAYAFRAGARASQPFAYRGFAAGCKAVSAMLTERDIAVRLNDDALFEFPFGDGYWSLLLDADYSYEQDMDLFFRGIADASYSLINCGANLGYWSVLASSKPYGAHRGIAIEPSPFNFDRLESNAKLNGGRFRCFQRAVGAEPGITSFAARGHNVITLHREPAETVPVIALDNLIEDNIITALGRYVIKLDVAGNEVQAIAGGERLLKSDCVLIYEERGDDPGHTVSRHVLSNTALKLFCFDAATGRFEHLRNASSLDRIKVATNTGYNVLATASAFWEQRIRALVGESSGADSRVRA